jgi:hypothetical protein
MARARREKERKEKGGGDASASMTEEVSTTKNANSKASALLKKRILAEERRDVERAIKMSLGDVGDRDNVGPPTPKKKQTKSLSDEPSNPLHCIFYVLNAFPT